MKFPLLEPRLVRLRFACVCVGSSGYVEAVHARAAMATEQQQKPKPQDAQASSNKPSFALTMLDRYVSSARRLLGRAHHSHRPVQCCS